MCLFGIALRLYTRKEKIWSITPLSFLKQHWYSLPLPFHPSIYSLWYPSVVSAFRFVCGSKSALPLPITWPSFLGTIVPPQVYVSHLHT